MIKATENLRVFNDFSRMSSNPNINYSAASSAQKEYSPQPQQPLKEENGKMKKVLITAASLAGTLIPLFLIRKKQGTSLNLRQLSDRIKNKWSSVSENNPNKLKAVIESAKEGYKAVHKSFEKTELEAKEMILMSLGALGGGFAAGMATEKDKSPQKTKDKVKDFIFQSFNVSLPALFTGSLMHMIEKNASKFKNVIPLKIAATVVGVGAGMPVAAMVSNKINKTFVDENDKGKKIHPKNYLVHADDAVSALVLAKVPFIDKLPVKEILPAIFAKCGYETGTGEEE